MRSIFEETRTHEEAVSNGWVFSGVYPQPNQPSRLHSRFMAEGHEVADCEFDGQNNLVRGGQYALWLRAEG